jgi:single-strand DNA-binding protein
MNSVALVGNVGQNPVLRATGNGTPVANVTLATNRVYRDRDGNRQQSTEWHRLVVWGEGARNFADIVRSGDKVAVRGRLEYRLREVAGEKVWDATIRVEEWHQLTPKKARVGEEAQPDELAYSGGDSLPDGEDDILF